MVREGRGEREGEREVGRREREEGEREIKEGSIFLKFTRTCWRPNCK